MIGNARQLSVAQKKLRELLSTCSDAEGVARATCMELILDLQAEIREFEGIRDGHIQEFLVRTADDVGAAVVKARIARGMNQRQLADEMKVSEQAVQKDESTLYERASLSRIAEILDALGHELTGVVRPSNTRSDALPGVSLVPAMQGRTRPAPVEANRQNSLVQGGFVMYTVSPIRASTVDLQASASQYYFSVPSGATA